MDIKIKINKEEFLAGIKKDIFEVNNAVKKGIQDTNGVESIQQGYTESPLNIRTHLLFNSFKEEKTDTSMEVYSDIPYARIHEAGGVTGRGHRTIIKPTNYFSNGVKILEDKLLANIKKYLKF